MKELIVVVGPNGVGKSTACRGLLERLPGTALVDSDAFRLMNPFSFTPEQIRVNTANLSCVIQNYLGCSTVDRILFHYGFHGPRKGIYDAVIESLCGIPFRLRPVILTCSLEESIRRMRLDGRDEARIKRATQNTHSLYDAYGYPRIDTTTLSPEQTVDRMLRWITDETI